MSGNPNFALYIHIPYCKHKCPYCDFNTYAEKSIPEAEYLAALKQEYYARLDTAAWQQRTPNTIYFGGGTPSIFSAAGITDFINFISKDTSTLQEITIEANPEEITAEKLKAYCAAGVTRLSFGAQSLNDRLLRILGRTHSSVDVQRAVELSYSAELKNLNLDLMFGIPEQTLDDLAADLTQYIKLGVPHVSPYNLTIEPGTTYHQRQHVGSLNLPSEEVALQMFELIDQRLSSAGLQQYEISNYSKPGYESIHNLAYWQTHDYLGLGAGAHSFSAKEGTYGRRWSNLANPKAYIQSVNNQGLAEAWNDKLDRKSAQFEYLFLGLRQVNGIDCGDFSRRFNCNLTDVYGPEIENLSTLGLIEYKNSENTNLALTRKGLLISDSVFEVFSKACLI